MKKLFALFLVVFTLSACSSSDDGNNSSNSQITPPSWIQGTWYINSDIAMTGYRFTHDDICILSGGGITGVCMKENMNLYHGTQIVTKVDQQISDTEYKCVVTMGPQVLDFHFRKISPNKIKDVNASKTSPVGDIIYIKQ